MDATSVDLDYTQQTTIYLRLVAVSEDYDDPRPLLSKSNPIPPRIDKL